jgi:NAD(P)H-dependent flavin oxidoreductase YrpB (nitropropane dioxygenase family)
MHPTLHTRACELFGVRYPVVQTGMGYVSGSQLTAATANAGGLGILGGGSMSYGRRRRSASTCAPTNPTSTAASTW